MYSVVLMVAMSSGTEASAFGGQWAYACPLDTCLPMRYGWVSCGPKCGYYPGCYGCGACYGCYGACYGGCYGCHGYLWPLAWGVYPPLLPYGGYGLYPAPPRDATDTGTRPGGMYAPGIGTPLPKPREEPKLPEPIRTSIDRTGSIALEVSADADVYIDGNRMKSKSTHRIFTTPPLEPGQEYYYWVRVVVQDGGKQIEESKKVFVRAGKQAEPSFAQLLKDRPAVVEATRRTDR